MHSYRQHEQAKIYDGISGEFSPRLLHGYEDSDFPPHLEGRSNVTIGQNIVGYDQTTISEPLEPKSS